MQLSVLITLNYIFSLILLTLPLLAIYRYSQKTISSSYKYELAQSELVLNWIKDHTKESDLFLNYSNIDIRVGALRPEYFRWKTYAYTADGQISWYQKALIYYNIPRSYRVNSYQEIKEFIVTPHEINLENVLNNANHTIKFILIPKKDKSYNFLINKNLKTVYENELFKIYVNEQSSYKVNQQSTILLNY